ncbi:hypothetical protein FA15DRAFT_752132 [Coprinopsis marcescibilis]|uniref:Uncharacterized protein n=1 Tax=Coprinopsis marcescibilis TaxID=230819 RepID=A0A5C3LB66_COPMA|nr:hypothetical protein FA15DRAFT_752132 [Coprinopsis marcescibilis]
MGDPRLFLQRRNRRSQRQLPSKKSPVPSAETRKPITNGKRLLRLYRGSKLYQDLQELEKNHKSPLSKSKNLSPGLKDNHPSNKAGVHQGVSGISTHKYVGFGYAKINLPLASKSNLGPLPTTGPINLPANLKGNLARPSASAASFIPLPPLLSVTSPRDFTSISGTTHSGAPSSTADTLGEAPDQTDRGIAPPVIVLVALGATCLLLGVGIVLRVCTRPRRKDKVKPSLPIMENGIPENDDFVSQESPVFGGKERLASTAPENDDPMWTWVQYYKPQNAELNTTLDAGRLADNGVTLISDLKRISAELAGYGTSVRNHKNNRHSQIAQQEPPNPEIAKSQRVSFSGLEHTGDLSGRGFTTNGTSSLTSFTGDGHHILQRTPKLRTPRRSKSYSDSGEQRRRDSAYRPDTAYEGADVSSPPGYYQPVSTPTIGLTPSAGTEGRARIQSSYFAAGTYPRLSSMPATYSIATATKANVSQAHLQAVTNLQYKGEQGLKDNGVPDRDLGLIYGDSDSPDLSYAHPSPQPTLYPDDSLSVIGSKRSKRVSQSFVQSKRLSKLHNVGNIPTSQSTKAGGSQSTGFLEMSFDVSRMSLSDISPGQTENISFDRPGYFKQKTEPTSAEKRNYHDKPPRVPSPPPMPSLAQMALVHSNPEAYNNYRSPTYSIYGLYGDRKSSATANMQ